jgi:hypothetical protein
VLPNFSCATIHVSFSLLSSSLPSFLLYLVRDLLPLDNKTQHSRGKRRPELEQEPAVLGEARGEGGEGS